MDLGRTLEEWLTNLDLGQYIDYFRNIGLTDLEHCKDLDDGFLHDIGVSKPEHRKRLLQGLQLLKSPAVSNAGQGRGTQYVNFPTPVDDSIYQNLAELPQERALPTPCSRSSQVAPAAEGAVSPESTANVKKKPVPKPRRSKNAVPSNVTSPTNTSPDPVSVKHGHSKPFSIDGTTNGESSTDDSCTMIYHRNQNDFTGRNVKASHENKIIGDRELTGAQNDSFNLQNTSDHSRNHGKELQSTSNSVSLEEEDPSYVNTSEAAYEPIWMSTSSANQKPNEQSISSNNIGSLAGKQGLAAASPVSPEAPPPCRTHFPFSGNVRDSIGSTGSAPLTGGSVGMPSPSPLADDIYENNDFANGRSGRPLDIGAPFPVSCKPPPFEDLSPSCDIMLPVRDYPDSSSSSDEHCSDEDNLPPPMYPPPPLPGDPRQSMPVSLVDLAEFDPLLAPSLPPVPPRPDASKTPPPSSGDYVNTSQTSALDMHAGTNTSTDQNGLYSFASAGMVTKMPQSPAKGKDLYAKVASKFPKFQTQTSVVSPTSKGPFHGLDPFAGEATFAQECARYNVETRENCVQDENSCNYEDFDPFGLNCERKGSGSSKSGSILTEVPPVPNWNQTAELPNASMYAMAQPSKSAFESTDESSDGMSEDTIDTPSENQRSYPVEILPTSNTEKKYERAQYLYKQGGVKGNKGWRKRWVVFTGQSLRYFTNSKSQVSKRIIPLSCMKKVDNLARDHSKDKFRFNLETTNRTFQFAAESLVDCTLWSNTLMAAILSYKPPPEGEKEGGDMYDPDKQGFVKFEKQDRRYVAIKQGKLSFYESEQDFKQASPIHEIELKLASVKDLSKDKLQLSTHYAHFTLVFDSYQDCVLWRMAIEEGIATGLGDNTVLEQVKENPSNRVCADCGMDEAHWASINLGIVLCKKCAGVHRNFDSRLSKVKSLRMDTRIWTPSLVEMMKIIGNENANKFWGKLITVTDRIYDVTPPEQRKIHIENKYKNRKFCDLHPAYDNQKFLNEMFLLNAKSHDVLVTMQLLFSGANIMCVNADGDNAFQLAKRAGERIQMEFLYQNGGDRVSMAFADTDEALANKLRAEVCLSGYLMKTGSNMKDFLKRWCVVEHGCLRYYSNEKSSVAKDSIEHESMLCVQATPVERSMFGLKNHMLDIRYQEAFELSTTKEKNNRVYLFAASSLEEKLTWLRTLCKLFCPVPLMEEMGMLEFSLAGTFYVKMGVSSEWEKTWLLMNRKVVQFTDKEFKLTEYIDLRKAKNIQRQESVSTCNHCLENGQCLALDIPGRALYIQADLRKDTDRLYEAFVKEMRAGGEYLDDQQLTQDDVPIIVDRCIKYIEDNAMYEEGIYRRPGVKSSIQLLLDKFKSDAHSVILQLGVHDVHEVASCLKQFLRGLKEPLLTSSRYEEWIKNAGRKDETVKLEWYRYLVDYLPPVHYNTLKRLIRHFVKLSEYSNLNKMTVQNIAIAFGPSLMESGTDRAVEGGHIPFQQRVLADLIKFNENLFPVDNEEKDKEELIQEAMKKIDALHRVSMMPSARVDSIKTPVHFLHHSNSSELLEVSSRTTAKQLVKNMKIRMHIQEGSYVLHEALLGGVITRPLHPTDNVFDIVMEWSNWPETYRNSACLCLKPEQELVQKLIDMYDPTRPLFAELKFIEKKRAVKHAFEFKQSRLSYYKDLKSANVSTPACAWNIEDLVVYHGVDPNARKQTTKAGLSFMKRGERPGSKDMPYFGHILCFSSEEELLHWMSAMLIAQHPDGLTEVQR